MVRLLIQNAWINLSSCELIYHQINSILTQIYFQFQVNYHDHHVNAARLLGV